MFIVFLSTHRTPERQNKRGEVSEDKVTYPLDEEGDNLNSYGGRGGKKKRRYVDFWMLKHSLTISQRGKRWNGVGGEREKEQNGPKNLQKMEKRAFARRALPLSYAVSTRVRDIDGAQENERERGRARERDCVSASPRRIGYGAVDAGALLRH